MGKNAVHRCCHSTKKGGHPPQNRRRQGGLDVSTVFVDNFVDKGKLMPGNHQHEPCNLRKPGKKSKYFLFKIKYLKNAPEGSRFSALFCSAVHK
jgi:hypothetical protein